MKPMESGETPQRKQEDIQGYSRESRYNVENGYTDLLMF